MRIGRSLTVALLAVAVLPCWGCGLAPHAFRKMQHPDPLERARSVGQGGRESDAQVVPALVARLDDEDPVVRLTANEELRQRTGRDFGYLPWASPEERAGAIARWRSWLSGPPMPAASIQAPELPPLVPVKSTPEQKLSRREKRRRARTQPPTPIPPPARENAPS